jgi:hypothetical protein
MDRDRPDPLSRRQWSPDRTQLVRVFNSEAEALRSLPRVARIAEAARAIAESGRRRPKATD